MINKDYADKTWIYLHAHAKPEKGLLHPEYSPKATTDQAEAADRWYKAVDRLAWERVRARG